MEETKKIDILADRLLKRAEFKRNFAAFIDTPLQHQTNKNKFYESS